MYLFARKWYMGVRSVHHVQYETLILFTSLMKAFPSNVPELDSIRLAVMF